MTPRRLIEPARLAGTALLHTQTDERLVDLARAGNDRAFEAIVSRYRKQLLRYAAGILPPERAEDAVQQAFLNAYKAIVSGEAELKLKPWLYKITHNASLNLLRQNGWSYDQIPEDFDGVQQPPQAVEQKEHLRSVVASVQQLPERQRDAMILRELEGRSYEEIALALGVTGGAVRQLLNRARTTLRAAATAVTPSHLVQRVAESGAGDAPVASRIAELSVGAGGAATIAKVGTALVVAGAVAGGVTAGPLHHSGGSGPRATDAAEAVQLATGGGSDSSGRPAPGLGLALLKGHLGAGHGIGRSLALHARHGGPHGHGLDGRGGLGGGPALARGPDGHGGAATSGTVGDDHGGRSGHDGSGSSSSGSGDGHSGSGSSGSGTSGSSGSGDSGSSGSGSSGSSDGVSGSSGSGSGSSGSGSSGSGDSGSSGSGSSGSGSTDGGSSSGSGTSGSGDTGTSGGTGTTSDSGRHSSGDPLPSGKN